MSSIIPRAAEVKQVVALLESDEFDTSEDMGKAIVRLVAGLLSERDSYGVGFGLRTDGMRLAKGPYWGRAQAEKEARRLRDAGVVAFVAPLFSTDVQPEQGVKSCQCGHPKERHHNTYGCATYTQKEKCSCRNYSA